MQDGSALLARRPFMWQGEVYVGHWVKLGWPTDKGPPPASQECISKGGFGAHSCELSTLSRLNFQTRQLELRFLFQKPLQGTRLKCAPHWLHVVPRHTCWPRVHHKACACLRGQGLHA